jgi:hypothetical protein
MLYVNCDVRLAGDNNNIVSKKNVSVAEVALLRQIHGADAVTNIQSTGRTDTISATKERERLKALYKPELVMAVFPGVMPQLPARLEDIEVPSEEDDGDAQPAARRGRPPKAAETATPPAAE